MQAAMPGATPREADSRAGGLRAGEKSPITVLIADDHAVVREALRSLIDAQPDLSVVCEAGDGQAAVDAVSRHSPRIALMDLSMSRRSGLNATQEIVRRYPGTRVVALTMHEETGHLRALLEAGASGYVLKRSASGEVLRALRAVAQGGVYLDPALAGRLVDTLTGSRGGGAAGRSASGGAAGGPAAAPPPLSEREEAVLRRIAQGYSNKEIAAQLSLSVKTVETYKARSMEKLGLGSRVDIVRHARDQGWLETL